MANQDETQLVQKISNLYLSISKLTDLRPSPEVNSLFSDLVRSCIPPSSIDIDSQTLEVQEMRANLINLCSQAEGQMETHYSDLLATHPSPLDHLTLFPYYTNYLKLAHLEYTLLSRHCTRPLSRVAFIGSGPLPLTSIVLASRHLLTARFHNYDLNPEANVRARALVATDPDLSTRMVFHTVDVLEVGEHLRGYDVVFLAALVGVGREEKNRVLAHLAHYMAPDAMLVVRSAQGARAFLYPIVDPNDLHGFEFLTLYHPEDDVINSVIVARKAVGTATAPMAEARKAVGTATAAMADPLPAMMLPCKCGEIQAFNPLVHRCMMEHEEQIS